jgi:hypothetical protein
LKNSTRGRHSLPHRQDKVECLCTRLCRSGCCFSFLLTSPLFYTAPLCGRLCRVPGPHPRSGEADVLRLCTRSSTTWMDANDVRVAAGDPIRPSTKWRSGVVEKRTSSAERCGADDFVECLCICEAVANDTICLCVANDFVQAEKRTSSAQLRLCRVPLHLRSSCKRHRTALRTTLSSAGTPST